MSKFSSFSFSFSENMPLNRLIQYEGRSKSNDKWISMFSCILAKIIDQKLSFYMKQREADISRLLSSFDFSHFLIFSPSKSLRHHYMSSILLFDLSSIMHFSFEFKSITVLKRNQPSTKLFLLTLFFPL